MHGAGGKQRVICVGCAEKWDTRPEKHECAAKIADGVDPASLIRDYTELPPKPKADPKKEAAAS